MSGASVVAGRGGVLGAVSASDVESVGRTSSVCASGGVGRGDAVWASSWPG